MFADDIDKDERAPSPSSAPGAEDAARELWKNLTELREYGLHFLAARVDRWRLSMRKAALWLIAGVLGSVALATTIIVSITHLIAGLADALTAVLGVPWAGSLLVGLGLIMSLTLATYLFMRSVLRRSRIKTLAKYEQWQNRQRARFGHDVSERAKTGVPAGRG